MKVTERFENWLKYQYDNKDQLNLGIDDSLARFYSLPEEVQYIIQSKYHREKNDLWIEIRSASNTSHMIFIDEKDKTFGIHKQLPFKGDLSKAQLKSIDYAFQIEEQL